MFFIGLLLSHDLDREFYELARLTRGFLSFLFEYVFFSSISSFNIWLVEIGIYNFFTCFLWSYLTILTQVWQVNPSWLELFFIFLIFFQFYPSTLSGLEIMLHNLFWFVFYDVISVLWPGSYIWLYLGWLGWFFVFFF